MFEKYAYPINLNRFYDKDTASLKAFAEESQNEAISKIWLLYSI